MIEKSLFLIGTTISLLFLIGTAYAQSGNSIIDNWNSVTEDFDSSVDSMMSYFDKQIYLCMQLEELGGFEQNEEDLNEKEKKQNADCKELLEETDYFKKKELIKKYGELDN